MADDTEIDAIDPMPLHCIAMVILAVRLSLTPLSTFP